MVKEKVAEPGRATWSGSVTGGRERGAGDGVGVGAGVEVGAGGVVWGERV